MANRTIKVTVTAPQMEWLTELAEFHKCTIPEIVRRVLEEDMGSALGYGEMSRRKRDRTKEKLLREIIESGNFRTRTE